MCLRIWSMFMICFVWNSFRDFPPTFQHIFSHERISALLFQACCGVPGFSNYQGLSFDLGGSNSYEVAFTDYHWMPVEYLLVLKWAKGLQLITRQYVNIFSDYIIVSAFSGFSIYFRTIPRSTYVMGETKFNMFPLLTKAFSPSLLSLLPLIFLSEATSLILMDTTPLNLSHWVINPFN